MTNQGWHAELELWFENKARATRLMRRRHVGPLAIQRPFYPESDGSAHAYILHPPGGVAGGDELAIQCHVGPLARIVLTTPGATKFYRSRQGDSLQKTEIDVGPGGVCEYLPQETIVFDGARATLSTRVHLAADAVYLGWDFVSLGRPACGETFDAGHLRQRVEILREGRPIWFEQLRLGGADPALGAAFALAGKPIVGTMVYAGPAADTAIDRMRAALGSAAGGLVSITRLERVIVCRYLGARMSEGKALFRRLWEILRETALDKPASAPRIWAT